MWIQLQPLESTNQCGPFPGHRRSPKRVPAFLPIQFSPSSGYEPSNSHFVSQKVTKDSGKIGMNGSSGSCLHANSLFKCKAKEPKTN